MHRTYLPSVPILAALAALAPSFSLAAQTPVDWGNLQFPPSITVGFGSPTPLVYGKVYKAGVTEAPGAAPGITAQLGYGPGGSDPATSLSWQWVTATFNVQVGNDDEYTATLSPLPGVHDYAFRYSHNGSAFVYGDLDGSTNGYSPAQAGNLVVTGSGTPIDWGNLQFPGSLLLPAGTSSPLVFGRVFKTGITEAPGPGLGITAQLGYGPDGTDPATSQAWLWFDATFNLQVGNEDEFMASFTAPLPGSYDFAYRYACAGSPFVYGDLDGSGNGYSTAQAGSLTTLGNVTTIPSNCAGTAPLSMTVLGSPALGGAVTSTLTGLGGGFPATTWTVGPPSQMLLPFCPCVVSTANGWVVGAGFTLSIPVLPGLIGAQILAQGIELLGPAAACSFPVPLNLTDIVAVTIG